MYGEDLKFGLICSENNTGHVNLSKVEISCAVTDLTSTVCTTCTYKNNLNDSVEAKYVFPLNNVALFSFEALIDDRKIVAECRPRAEAKQTYDDAVSSGHSAFMAEQDQGCEDVFQMKLGNIPGQSTVVIVLKYVGQLEAENLFDQNNKKSHAIFTLPSVLNPRYTPSEPKISEEFEPITSYGTVRPYSITFSADLNMPVRIANVSSPLDRFDVEWTSTNHKVATVKMSSEFKADHDLQMIIEMDHRLDSFAVCEWGNPDAKGILSKDCLMAQFMPDFSQVANELETRTELYFVIDRSGSMSGSNIKHASESLLLFIKSLPPGCRFQIIGFGDTHAALFPEPVDYNDANMTRALEYQRSLEADMGGTEVLPALAEAFKSPLTGLGWYKQIIFFTDGDVGNANEVIGLVRSNVSQACVFTIGIGTGASTYLVEGVARAGRGVATFIRDTKEMRAATMKVLNAALQPRASDIKVNWELMAVDLSGKANPLEVITVPQQVPPIFKNCFATVYGLFDYDHRCSLSGQITLECEVFGKKQVFRVGVSEVISERLLSANVDLPLHRLCGKCQLNEMSDRHKAIQMKEQDAEKLENDPDLKILRTKIELLSCALNVISPFTAFIGVDPVKREPVKYAPPAPAYDYCDGFQRPQMARCFIPAGAFHEMDESDGCDTDLEYASENCNANADSAAVGMTLHSTLVEETKLETFEKPDVLLRLVELQSAGGSWNLNCDLAECLNLSLNSIQTTLPKCWPDKSSKTPVSESVWATALALACLELTMSDRSDEWMLLARKANLWLMEQATLANRDSSESKQSCDKLLQMAKQVLQSNQKSV